MSNFVNSKLALADHDIPFQHQLILKNIRKSFG